MDNKKVVVDKMIDILARQYRKVLRKYEMQGNVDVTELSSKIINSLEEGKDVTQIQSEITNFFGERIEEFNRKAGEIAIKEGKSLKHKKLMEDLRGLSGKFDKECAEAIIKFTTEKEKSQYLDIAEKGILVSPELTNKDNISLYKKAVEKAKKFPTKFRPDNILESKIFEQVNGGKNKRRILLDGVREKDQSLMTDYDKMIAHYLLMGGDKPVERFSKVEMAMKQYGLRPDLGASIMKYGDELTSKLEELAKDGMKSPQEWEIFKNEVLHSFTIAENIGNRNVNSQEHIMWEERLVRLGLLERKIEKTAEQDSFNEGLKLKNEEKSPDSMEQGVLLDDTMTKRAQKQYENTGTIPLGYKLSEDGKTVVSIASTITLTPNNPKDRIRASKNDLSISENLENKTQIER